MSENNYDVQTLSLGPNTVGKTNRPRPLGPSYLGIFK